MNEKKIKQLAGQTQFGYGQYSEIMQARDDLMGRSKRAKAKARRLVDFASQCEYLLKAVNEITFVGRVPVRREGNLLLRTTIGVWDGREIVRELLPGDKTNKFLVKGRYPEQQEFHVILESGYNKDAVKAEEDFFKDSPSPDKDER